MKNPKQIRRGRRKAERDDHRVSRYTASERKVLRMKRLAEMKRSRADESDE